MADFSNMQASVDAYDAQIKSTEERLRRLAAERLDIFKAACPVRVGDIVVVTRDRSQIKAGTEMLVREVEIRSWCKLGEAPWLLASAKKADGSWATRTYRLFDCYKAKL